MTVPERKTSKQRRNKRRTSSYQLPKTTAVECPNCRESKLPHHVCLRYGYYDGKKIISMGD